MKFFKSHHGPVYHQPETIDELKELITGARQSARVMIFKGAGHSFPLTDQLALPNDRYVFVMLTYLNRITAYDWQLGIFTVQAGCRIGYDPFDETGVSTLENSLIYQLDPLNEDGTRSLPPGWSLPELGGITHQTIGGFITTGSAGGSTSFALCDAIESVRILYHDQHNVVDKTFTRGQDDAFFAVGYSSLGLLGIIVEITFRCKPAFIVRGSEVTTTSAKSFVDIWCEYVGSKQSVKQMLMSHDYCRLLWWPQKTIDKVLIWSAEKEEITDWENYKPNPYISLPVIAGSTRLSNQVFGAFFHVLGHTLVLACKMTIMLFGKTPEARNAINGFFRKLSTGLLKLFLGILAPDGKKTFDDAWWRALPMDDQFSDKFAPVKFTELWIPLHQADAVMLSLKEFYLDPENAGTFCSEIYAGRKNEFWLSPSYGEDMIRVDVFWFGRNAGDPEEYFKRFWRHLKPFNFRYHWGKYIGFADAFENTQHISPLYPRWNDFMELRKKHDPYKIFLNDYWKKYLAIEGNDLLNSQPGPAAPAASTEVASIPIPIIDLHCHPALKIYLFNKNFSHLHHPWSDVVPFGMHVDLPGIKAAHVKVALCTHYIPEAGLGKLDKTEWLYKLLKIFLRKIINRWERASIIDDAYKKCLRSIDRLDRQVEKAAAKFNVVVARDYATFKTAYENGKTIIIHTIEGAHQLGSGSLDPNHYIKHLEILKQKGVCCITISHFFPNAVCGTGGGIPPSTAKKIGYQVNPNDLFGLTPVGKEVVHWCQQNGMLICFKHANVNTRKDVYEILQQRKEAGLKVLPVGFTHAGVRELAAPHMRIETDKYMLPDVKELKTIQQYNGVIGVILMNYWLIGIEEDNPVQTDTATPLILRTIEFIAAHLGTYDNIAIGTDLDGFSQVPDDLKHIRHLQKLAMAIEKRFGRTIAEKICHGNSLRVLKEVWES